MRNLTIAARIRLSFATAVGMVLVIGFLSFYYLSQFSIEFHELVTRDIHLARVSEEIKSSIFDIHRNERAFFAEPTDPESFERLKTVSQKLVKLMNDAHLASAKQENIQRYEDMTALGATYLEMLNKIHSGEESQLLVSDARKTLIKIGTLNHQALQARYKDLEQHQIDAEKMASNAQRNMIVVIILMLLSGLGLGFVAPNLVAAPFRKINRAIAQIGAGKMNINIPEDTNDELGTLALNLNNMLDHLRTFDDMKIKRIAFEKRRLESMANMIDYGVMVLSCEGEIEFINTQLYLLLRVESEACVGYHVTQSPLPIELKELLTECLDTQEKFDNRELTLKIKDQNNEAHDVEFLVDLALVRRHDGSVANLIVTLEDKKAQAYKNHLTRKMIKPSETDKPAPTARA